MSEFHVVVVTIDNVEKHPNADKLGIVNVHGGYPCIVKLSDFSVGDLAVYCPIDSMVPLADERWAFLKSPHHPDRAHERIKAKKLRGLFSMGLLTKAEPDWKVGENKQEALGILKYDPDEGGDGISRPGGKYKGGLREKNPGFIPVYTDIEGYRKHKSLLIPGEQVVMLEKIHGSNSRFASKDGKFYAGSHRYFRKEDAKALWWKIAYGLDLKTKLAKYDSHVFYGEAFGQVQDLKYGAGPSDHFFSVFDIFSCSKGKYLDWNNVEDICGELEIKMVPVLYKGPWSTDLETLRNGKTMLNADHTREGFVVKPLEERWDAQVGRVILKFVGEDYLLRP